MKFLATLALATGAVAASVGKQAAWKKYSADLLTESMAYMDPFYDAKAGYLIDTDIDNGFSALYHTTRESAWYAAGLLARNQNNDSANAVKIIKAIISGQYQDPADLWYGVYQVFPEEPTPGTAAYPAVIYNSWDPNWREFVATTFVVIVEEYASLIGDDVVALIEDSVLLAAVGDTYRGCGLNGDNFCTCYSNPLIMSAAFTSWAGARKNNANITAYGHKLATDIVALFDEYNTLSEFNSGTYAGVSLFGLTLWAKYFDNSTVLGQNGGRLITSVWDKIADTYNANLKNMAGPWDRTYGYDLNRYVGITALWMWTIVGKDTAPGYTTPGDMAHVSDFQFGALAGILGPYHNSFLSSATIRKLGKFPGAHIVNSQVYSPPYDLEVRNVTTWMGPKITIGTQSFYENVIGGPSTSQTSFSPAVVQWERQDGTVGFASLYPEAYQMVNNASAHTLTLSLPQGDDSSQFVFHVSPNGLSQPVNVAGWEDINGVNVTVSGTVDTTPTIAYCGANGGTCSPIDLFELWNFTYSMPPGSTEIPSITLNFHLDY